MLTNAAETRVGDALIDAIKRHWPEYLIESAGLALFMISACSFAVLLEHPASPVHAALPDMTLRRVLMGIAMGLTAISIIYSPWGQRSGAHLNPAVTFTFYRLGKVEPADAFFYVVAQFIGGVAGVLISSIVYGGLVSDPAVNYVATAPGAYGPGVAFAAEVTIAFVMMTMVLNVSNRMNIARYTGLLAGLLVACYISIEAPISGMSLNPARTFGSAFVGRFWMGLWIYFIAPPLGMTIASMLYVRKRPVICAKMHHPHDKPCIFKECGYHRE